MKLEAVINRKASRDNSGILMLALLACAAVLRFLLFLANPPYNTFDDHFEPIFMIMQTGQIPAKDACWQCFHPPVFYSISAAIGNFALAIRIPAVILPKIFQLLCCLYGVMGLGVIGLILKKLPLTRFARLMSFAIVCFLPPHIYASAMNSNDTLSYLLVAATVYWLLMAIERGLSLPWIALLSAGMTFSIFTKYTAFALLPAVFMVFLLILFRRIFPPEKIIAAVILTILLPLGLLGGYCFSNVQKYGKPLPWNDTMQSSVATQPRAKHLSFVTFKPWKAAEREILYPDLLDSFWTQLYGKMWFDVEPKFLSFTDPDEAWWNRYYDWLKENKPLPDEFKKFSLITRVTGAGLILLGLIPLALMIAGTLRIIFGRWSFWSHADGIEIVKMQIFPWLFLWSLAGVVFLAVKTPVYSVIKAVYLLSALPAMAVLMSAGLMLPERNDIVKKILMALFAVLFILAAAHILNIVGSMGIHEALISSGSETPAHP